MQDVSPKKVSIHCLVYNHAPYLRDCLEGFVKQQTNFAFEAIVHDDASTDGSGDIIREYAERYPHIIKPILQKKNLYQSPERYLISKSIAAISTGEYKAICEGDDYWTDPTKLQKQVDFLEANPDYSMVCTDADVLTPHGTEHWHRYSKSCEVPLKDIVMKGGAWIHTASILYRANAISPYPIFCKKCHVGDYPLQILLAIRGKVHFIAERMVVYRYMSIGSWSSTTKITDETYFQHWLSEINMLKGFNELTEYRNNEIFSARMAKYAIVLLRHVPTRKKDVLAVLPQFPRYLKFSDRLKWWRILTGLNGIKRKLQAFFKRNKA